MKNHHTYHIKNENGSLACGNRTPVAKMRGKSNEEFKMIRDENKGLCCDKCSEKIK